MEKVTLESSVKVEGIVRADERAPMGIELSLINLTLYHLAEEYPITKKEHGTGFLNGESPPLASFFKTGCNFKNSF